MNSTPPPPSRRAPDPILGAASVVSSGLILLAAAFRPGPAAPDAGAAALVAAVVGILLPLPYPTGFRAAGLLPIGLTLFLAGAALDAALRGLPAWLAAVAGGGAGLAVGAVGRYWLGVVRALSYRGAGPTRWVPAVPRSDRILDATIWAVILANAAVFISLDLSTSPEPEWWRQVRATEFFAAAVFLTAFAWHRLFRPLFELCVEPVLWLGYRVRGRGPGLTAVPPCGPLIVIANHACWWDPLFLAKLLPRPVTPMMTAKFYDIWFLRPLMVHTFQVIRVNEVAVRKATPEVDAAVRALDEGKCLVVFPEGFLRRKEDLLLRRFGRGIWEILKARPDTPVVACWIEGGWGSWASYWNGPPARNKKIDFRRPVGVGVSAPVTVGPDALANHLRTRLYLMNEVLAARKHVGLPDVPLVELPANGENGERGA